MTKIKKIFLMIFLWAFAMLAFAMPENTYLFNSKEQQQTFAELTQEFRCLVCQNESLADSNAVLASDLRQRIANMIRQGDSKQQIKQYLVQRYGAFILFKPPFETNTYFLWLAPLGLFISAILFLIFKIKKPKKKSVSLTLTLSEQQRLQALLVTKQD